MRKYFQVKLNKSRLLIFLSFAVLFSAFLYNYLSLNIWDYDFWWHIATGRYIVEKNILPQTDPFSYTSELEENKNLHPERESFILKQYWLAQVIFYLLYEAAGDKGIIILRAIILLSVVLCVFWGLYKNGVKFYITFIFVFLTYISTMKFTGERPVLFTLLFSVIVFLLLDNFRQKRGKSLSLLIPVMLLWSNMHGGFILGDIIILIYIVCESIEALIKRAIYHKKELLFFYLFAGLAIAISFVNPSGADAFFIAFSQKYKIFTEGIQEYQPPFLHYKNKVMPINYGYISMLLLFIAAILLRIKKMSLSRILLLSGLCYFSLTSARFVAYYIIIGAIILGGETHLILEGLFANRPSLRRKPLLLHGLVLFTLLSSILYFIGVVRFESFKFRQATWYSIPEGGVDFIEKNHLPGRIFNEFGIGGYVTWRLYPWKKTFIDTRAINYILKNEYNYIMHALYSREQVEEPEGGIPHGKTALWERLLNHYNVNLVLLVPLEVYGEVPNVLFKLAESNKWVPVYNDQLSIIFIRNTKENKDIIRKFKKTKEDVYNTMILQASWRSLQDERNPYYVISLGETFYKMGRLEDSLKAYKYALKRMPNPNVQEKIKQIESEIKTKEKEKSEDLPDKKRLKGKNIEKTKKT